MREQSTRATLTLQNGETFTGRAFGHIAPVAGAIAFHTSTVGTQEALTDPTLSGKLLVATYPLMGNYGANLEDEESGRAQVRALIVREYCTHPSNWRCEMELEGYLQQNKVVGLSGIDTRALLKSLRKNGMMNAAITIGADKPVNVQETLFEDGLVAAVTTAEPYHIPGSGAKAAVLDFGLKRSVLQELKNRRLDIYVYPAAASMEDILAQKPDFLFLSNGPGDPALLANRFADIKALAEKLPVIAIGLGYQVLALSFGLKTKKLEFGHYGGAMPVRCLATGRLYHTVQSHDYVVEAAGNGFEAGFVNVNDGTLEGLRHTSLPIVGAQFHPSGAESGASSLYDNWFKQIGVKVNA